MSIVDWKLNKIQELKHRNDKITFIHTPKTAGTSLTTHPNFATYINYKGHTQASERDHSTFTIIRHPIQRFESFLNYRLGEKILRRDFSPALRIAFQNNLMSLDDIVQLITLEDINKFNPFRFLTYWTHNVKVCLTIDEIDEFFTILDIPVILPERTFNVSKKTRGNLSKTSIEKITSFYKDDIELYNQLIRRD